MSTFLGYKRRIRPDLALCRWGESQSTKRVAMHPGDHTLISSTPASERRTLLKCGVDSKHRAPSTGVCDLYADLFVICQPEKQRGIPVKWPDELSIRLFDLKPAGG